MYTLTYRGPWKTAFSESTYQEVIQFEPTNDGSLQGKARYMASIVTCRNRLIAEGGNTGGVTITVTDERGRELSPEELRV